MEGLGGIGRVLIIFGLILAAIGAILALMPRLPWLGRLPGDIYIRKGNFIFYFPIATSIILSIILTLVLYLFFRR